MKTNDIRRTFLDFFAERGHEIIPSASLVPVNDPTLLFTNAGMVQFKDAFLGRAKPPAARIADVQRCLRAGGKHNDLENVGYTARHHTFFEMLGNWSFGDYFKREAIAWSWELLTEVFGLPADRLWVSVYETDDEAYDIWKDVVVVPKARIVRIGDNKGAPFASDNFWQMADTGPCGPCTEIFYDHDPDGSLGIAGGPPGSEGEDGDRFVEVWNLVFMQYDRAADGTMTPLPEPCVDTGMGLERIAAVLQGVHSNYDIDLFQHLIRAAAEATGTKDLQSNSLKVIADHIRATAFLIADGVLPSNEGRGYVLRRIMRRAIRHGYQLGKRDPFFYELVRPLAEEMGGAYPELHEQRKSIEQAVFLEEERFAKTLDTGMKALTRKLDSPELAVEFLRREYEVSGYGQMRPGVVKFLMPVPANPERVLAVLLTANSNAELQRLIREEINSPGLRNQNDWDRAILLLNVSSQSSGDILVYANEQYETSQVTNPVEVLTLPRVLSGKVAFTLYDTYGFPIDLTADVARERGVAVDMAGFEREMGKQRERARAASRFDADYNRRLEVDEATEFSGYDHTVESATVTALFRGNESAETLSAGEEGVVVLDHTPFYAEAGGQVGDTGALGAKGVRFVVTDTQKRGAAHLHIGRLEKGALAVGDTVRAEVDADRRAAIVLNHSATHLLHAALRKILGEHVTQKGSLVAPDRLRFDFSHPQALTAEELNEIEDRVNAEIRRNAAADVREMPYDEAIAAGAMALFGEKYGDTVRVMRFGDFSTELCGGTHVTRTGDIGLFKIVSESGIAAGIRRIEAVTGDGALRRVREEQGKLDAAAAALKTGRDDIAGRAQQLVARNRELERELSALRAKLASGQGGDLAGQAVEVAGLKLVAARLDGADAQTLRTAVDRLKFKLGSAAIVLGAADGGKVRLAAGVTPDLVKRLPAGELVNAVAERVGGRGGGRPDFAQAGGTEPANLDGALADLAAWVENRLAKS